MFWAHCGLTSVLHSLTPARAKGSRTSVFTGFFGQPRVFIPVSVNELPRRLRGRTDGLTGSIDMALDSLPLLFKTMQLMPLIAYPVSYPAHVKREGGKNSKKQHAIPHKPIDCCGPERSASQGGSAMPRTEKASC